MHKTFNMQSLKSDGFKAVQQGVSFPSSANSSHHKSRENVKVWIKKVGVKYGNTNIFLHSKASQS